MSGRSPGTLAAAQALALALAVPVCAGESQPVTGTAWVSDDWAYGCDNTGACRATSLGGTAEGDFGPGLRAGLDFAPGNGPLRAVLSIMQGAANNIGAEEDHPIPSEIAGFAVDGVRLPLDDLDEDGGLDLPVTRYIVPPHHLARIAGARELQLLGANGAVLERISIVGLPDALAWVRQVHGSAAAVPPAPLTVPAPPLVNSRFLPRLSPEVAVAWQSAAVCPELELDLAERPLSQHVFPLDEAHDLVMLSCEDPSLHGWRGRMRELPLVRDTRDGSLALAAFDFPPGPPRDLDRPEVIWPFTGGAWFVDEDGRLHVLNALRDEGDCGEMLQFAWIAAETRFALVDLRAMPACRAAGEWISLYRRPVRLVRPD